MSNEESPLSAAGVELVMDRVEDDLCLCVCGLFLFCVLLVSIVCGGIVVGAWSSWVCGADLLRHKLETGNNKNAMVNVASLSCWHLSTRSMEKQMPCLHPNVKRKTVPTINTWQVATCVSWI